MGKGYMTNAQICRYFCIERTTLWRWCRSGYFPKPDTYGTLKRWKIETVEQFEQNNKRRTDSRC
ncbi:helix-turn-helix transcriptional regulator [Photobacterium profundum]|uniref:helix-turn-helix transcriptional regulator n=1 Tax=Photobacterium profundum TaxID=74109 RepID=UPI00030DCC3A|nr:helix-turn-helix domain-containing protein [Photobacterium profundum]